MVGSFLIPHFCNSNFKSLLQVLCFRFFSQANFSTTQMNVEWFQELPLTSVYLFVKMSQNVSLMGKYIRCPNKKLQFKLCPS